MPINMSKDKTTISDSHNKERTKQRTINDQKKTHVQTAVCLKLAVGVVTITSGGFDQVHHN